MGTFFVDGHNVVEAGHTLAPDSSLTATFDAIGFGVSNTTLNYLNVTNDTTVNIVSESAPFVTGGTNTLYQLAETNNDLTTVTITGSQNFVLGHEYQVGNAGDGVVTDIDATAPVLAYAFGHIHVPITIQSSLHLIDASASTGDVQIYAGATNTPQAGNYDDGATPPNADVTITYTGLVIKGGSGTDTIENDANGGVVTVGNGHGDIISLGGSNATATFGSGANDAFFVGASLIQNTQAQAPGSALGDTATFTGAGGAISIGTAAEAGGTAGTANIGHTNIIGAQNGMILNFFPVTSSNNLADEDAAVASATSLSAAENAAVKALDSAGVAYFSYHGDEYFIATNHAETAVSSTDAVVHLVGISPSVHYPYLTSVSATEVGGGEVMLNIGTQFL